MIFVLIARETKREPFVARSLTLAPRSLLLNRTETLATQAIQVVVNQTQDPNFPGLWFRIACSLYKP